MVFVDKLANIPKGGYWYNPVGFSALNRWVRVNNNLKYDHYIQEFTTDYSKTQIEQELGKNSLIMQFSCVLTEKSHVVLDLCIKL